MPEDPTGLLPSRFDVLESREDGPCLSAFPLATCLLMLSHGEWTDVKRSIVPSIKIVLHSFLLTLLKMDEAAEKTRAAE